MALEAEQQQLELGLAETGAQIARLQREQAALKEQLGVLIKLGEYRDFRELNWRSVAAEVARLEAERAQLGVPRTCFMALTAQLQQLEQRLAQTENQLEMKWRSVPEPDRNARMPKPCAVRFWPCWTIPQVRYMNSGFHAWSSCDPKHWVNTI